MLLIVKFFFYLCIKIAIIYNPKKNASRDLDLGFFLLGTDTRGFSPTFVLRSNANLS